VSRPLLLLDVDGPLNPWAARSAPPGFAEHRYRASRWGRRLTVRLNPRHGRDLLELAERTGAELAWATTWGHRANRVIGPAARDAFLAKRGDVPTVLVSVDPAIGVTRAELVAVERGLRPRGPRS
jgi:HAD domain in Swiss Army Knife RNA repair proteins